jgi:hypothetical protein
MAVDTNDGRTLEQRLRLIEDRFEIYSLIASHPPSADTGAGDCTASVWTEDGVFDRGVEFPRPTGRRRSPVGLRTPSTAWRSSRESRILPACPMCGIVGDTAFAISYLQILVPDRVGPLFDVPNHGSSRGFHVHRVSANRWEFVRTEEGWKIKRLTLRPLDGTPTAREILGGALEP